MTGANRHDVTQLELVLDEIVIDRPEEVNQHLCADRGYDYPSSLTRIVSRKYNMPCVEILGEVMEEKKNNPIWKARRWGGEISHSWFNRFRKILVRYEELADTYLALLHMGCGHLAYREGEFIYG